MHIWSFWCLHALLYEPFYWTKLCHLLFPTVIHHVSPWITVNHHESLSFTPSSSFTHFHHLSRTFIEPSLFPPTFIVLHRSFTVFNSTTFDLKLYSYWVLHNSSTGHASLAERHTFRHTALTLVIANPIVPTLQSRQESCRFNNSSLPHVEKVVKEQWCSVLTLSWVCNES